MDFTNGNTMIIICVLISIVMESVAYIIGHKIKHTKLIVFVPVCLSGIGIISGYFLRMYMNQMLALGIFMYSLCIFLLTLSVALIVCILCGMQKRSLRKNRK